MHNVLSAKTFRLKVSDILNINPSKLKDKLGDKRYEMFCKDFKVECFDKINALDEVKNNIYNQEVEIVLKEINNDKYSKYKRLFQLELDITYSDGQKAKLLRAQFEIAKIEPENKLLNTENVNFEPFEECSLLSSYSQEISKGLAVEIGEMVHNGEV